MSPLIVIRNGHSMKVNMMNELQLERIIDYQLEEMTLEEFFELFNVTRYDIIQTIYDEDKLDEELLERMLPIG